MPAQMGEQHGWASRVAAFLGITPSFCATMDMGGATAIGMMQTAVMAIEAGFCEVVLCTFGTQTNPQGIIPQLFGSPWAIPYGDVGAITFMSHVARRQMHEHGIASVDYGHIAVTWRRHAQRNPDAQMRKPMTIEDHQASRFVNEPLRLFDCCLFTDGGGAFVVTSAERARDLRAEAGAASRASGRCTRPRSSARTTTGAAAAREAGEQAFRMAGCTPHDIDVVAALRRLHAARGARPGALRLRGLGRGGAAGRGGRPRTLGGKLPCNTAGGLALRGTPVRHESRRGGGPAGPRHVLQPGGATSRSRW